jgi:predicted small lipoprotein YifL
MRSRAFAQLIGNLIAGLFALMLLQSCGLKGDLYLEDGEDSSATIREQENEEFLEESLDEQTEDLELDEGPSFEEERTEIIEGR